MKLWRSNEYSDSFVRLGPTRAARERLVFNVLFLILGLVGVASWTRLGLAFGSIAVPLALFTGLRMIRASVTRGPDSVVIRNVWWSRTVPCDDVVALVLVPRFGYWVWSADARFPSPRDVVGVAIVVEDRELDCEALRCSRSSKDFPEFIRSVDLLGRSLDVPREDW